MARMQFGKLIALAAALTVTLVVMGCASGPLGSHGVDYIPAFDAAPPNAAIEGRLVAQAATIEGKVESSN
ncbi:MAG TPA: hypothetical protein VH855_10260 [Acetobacteraceae bacterium]|jgi:hypothetical protein